MAKITKAEKGAIEAKIRIYEQAEQFIEERKGVLPVKTHYKPLNLLLFIKEQLTEMRARIAK